MSSWVKLAERLVRAIERLADATEAIAAMKAEDPVMIDTANGKITAKAAVIQGLEPDGQLQHTMPNR